MTIIVTTINNQIEVVAARARELKRALRQSLTRRLDAALVRFFTYAMERHAVQKAVAIQFEENCTPFCQALERAAERAADESIRGADFDDQIAHTVEACFEDHQRDMEIEARHIEGLDDAIEEYVDKAVDIEEIVEKVLEELADRLAKRRR